VSRLVSNILDASRIEAGVLRPNRDWEYVRELVLRAVREANRHGHEVRTDFPDKLPLLWIDAVKIEQVVTNLIENAGQYSPPGSVIHVDVTVADTVLEIGVADQGPGIPAHLRDRVFDKFFRVAGTRGSVGTGMGLAIVKGFTEAHGGTVRVEEAPGGGARFVVSLPLAGPERDMSATTITEGIEDGEHIDVAPTPRLPKP